MFLALCLGSALAGAEPPPTLSPTPARVELTGGWYTPTAPLSVEVSPTIPEEDAHGAVLLVQALGRAGWAAGLGHAKGSGIRLSMDDDLPDEGYVIDIAQQGVRVRAADRRGLVWAAMTLGQLAHARGLPLGHIEDQPALPLRWAHFQLPGRDLAGQDVFTHRRYPSEHAPRDTRQTLPILDALVQEALEHKLNGVVIEITPALRMDCAPEVALPEAEPLSALAPLLARLRYWYVDAIPLLPALSHQEQLFAVAHPDWMLLPLRARPKRQRADQTVWTEPVADPHDAALERATFACVDELVEAFQPRFFHLGHDEATGLSTETAADTFAYSVQRLRDHLAPDVRPVIWGDMLLPPDRVQGAAHGASTWEAIDHLPRDVLVANWQYHRTDLSALRYLRGHGLDVLGATLGSPRADPGWGADFATGVRAQGGLGMIVTHWLLGAQHARALASDEALSITRAAEQDWNAGR